MVGTFTLKTFREFVEEINEANILMEAKIDDLKSSVGAISTEHDPNAEFKKPDEIVDHFHKHNPTGDISHTRWAVSQYNKGNMKQEDAPSMKDTFNDFNRHKDKLPKKKIEQYKSVSDLRDAIRPHKGTTKAELGLTKSTETVQKGADLVHNEGGVKLYHVHTKEASKELGKGMPWCTSHRDDKRNLFDNYNKKTGGNFFIAHLPHEQAPHRKLGIGIGVGEFQDENNEKMNHEDLKALVGRNPSLGKIPHLQGARVATTEDHNKHFDKLIKNDGENLHHADISHETITKAMEHHDEDVREDTIRHPNVTSDHIDKALDDSYERVREAAIKNSKATIKHIDKALDDKEPSVREAAIQHPNVNSGHIDKALDDEEPIVRRIAIRNPNVNSKHIDKALDDKDETFRKTAIQHPKATLQHIDKALDDKDEDVRAAAIRHPNATTQHIDKALDDKDEDVRQTAIEHPNATTQHIDKALDDKDEYVRQTAIKHPKATLQHIDKALNDENEYVRAAAIRHPKATLQHIDKALKDPSNRVVNAAKNHPEYIDRELKDFK
jgi:hypothetical protein